MNEKNAAVMMRNSNVTWPRCFIFSEGTTPLQIILNFLNLLENVAGFFVYYLCALLSCFLQLRNQQKDNCHNCCNDDDKLNRNLGFLLGKHRTRMKERGFKYIRQLTNIVYSSYLKNLNIKQASVPEGYKSAGSRLSLKRRNPLGGFRL